MRTLLMSSLVALLAACTVEDKNPSTSDAGTDAPPIDPMGTPDTTLTSAPSEFSNAGTATFEFESNQADASFMCSVDGEPAGACTSPFSRALADGTHTFSVRAVNAAGDADDSPAEHLWSIDTVAPITTLTEAPAAADNSTMVRFSFIANEMNTVYECRLDNGDFEDCRSGDEFGPVSDGGHSFAVRAVDRAGNADASPATHTWVVDTSTPDTTLLTGPTGSVSSTSATFTFISPDAGPGATFECSLDGATFAACTSPAAYGPLSMGVHTFSVRVRDANNNLDPTPATRTWTIDASPPETTITAAPSGTVSMASANIAFTANEANVVYSCSLDGATMAACVSPFNTTGLAQGAHTFAVYATDMAGNADPSPATASWTVDTVTPDITLTGPDTGATTGPYVVYSFTATEGTVQCRIDGGDWAACSSPFDFNHPAGASTFEVRSVDAAGNETTVARSFTVACTAPDATDSAGLLHLEDAAQTLTNATGGAGATLGATVEVETADPTFTTGRFGMGLAFTPGETDIVAWPAAIGTADSYTFEVWAQPSNLSGARTIATTGDGRLAVRVTQDANSTVRFSASVTDAAAVMTTVTSATYEASAWHLVDVVQTPSALTIYVDGDATSIALDRTDVALDSLQLGGNFGGALDEPAVLTSAIDAATVLGRYCPVSTVRL